MYIPRFATFGGEARDQFIPKFRDSLRRRDDEAVKDRSRFVDGSFWGNDAGAC